MNARAERFSRAIREAFIGFLKGLLFEGLFAYLHASSNRQAA
jgi:hypothetical protein